MAADGPALLAAAVRAACLAKAPRRTIQAVAAAVAGVLARPAPAAATPRLAPSVPANFGRHAADGATSDASPEELLAALRAARAAQRKRKKERRRAKKATPHEPAPQRKEDESMPDAVVLAPQPLETPAAALPDAAQPMSVSEVRRHFGIGSQGSDDDVASVASVLSTRSLMTDADPLKRLRPEDVFTKVPPRRQRPRNQVDGGAGAAPSSGATKRR